MCAEGSLFTVCIGVKKPLERPHGLIATDICLMRLAFELLDILRLGAVLALA